MNKQCILNSKKECDNCGECDRCDLNSNKKCDNCGKCLELEGYDMKAIKIDEILEEKNDIKEYEKEIIENENHSQIYKKDNHNSEIIDDSYTIDDNLEHVKDETLEDMDNTNDNVEFIDDIDGLREIIEDDGIFKDLTYEEFPGFIRFKGDNNKED